MVSTRNNGEGNKKLLSLLSMSDTNFMIGENNHEAQTESGVNTMERNIT